MSLEKPELKELLRRLDELVRILKYLSEDLNEISKMLRTTMNSSISEPKQTIELNEPTLSLELGETRTVEEVQKVFPQVLHTASRTTAFDFMNAVQKHIYLPPLQLLTNRGWSGP